MEHGCPSLIGYQTGHAPPAGLYLRPSSVPRASSSTDPTRPDGQTQPLLLGLGNLPYLQYDNYDRGGMKSSFLGIDVYFYLSPISRMFGVPRRSLLKVGWICTGTFCLVLYRARSNSPSSPSDFPSVFAC